jgi:GNAT superfamily N-acetyltransferase
MRITYSKRKDIPIDQLVQLYNAVGWSAANKPDDLHKALANSHSLISAWHEGQLVGLGNSISDGFLVVYYPHLLIHPNFQGTGIGTQIMRRLIKNYANFHQQILIEQILVADVNAIDFYRKLGFVRAPNDRVLIRHHNSF